MRASPYRRRAEWVFHLLIGLILIGTAVTVSAVTPDAIATGVFVCGLLVALPLLLPLTGRPFDLFEPPVLVAAAFTPLFVLRPWYELRAGLTNQGFLGQDYGSYLARALGVAAVGLLSLYLGYYIGPGRRIARNTGVPVSGWDPSRLRNGVMAITTASVLAFSVFAIQSGGLGFLRLFITGRTQQLADTLRNSSAYLYAAPDWCVGVSLLLLARTPRWLSIRAVPGWLLLLYGLSTKLGPGSRSFLLPVIISLAIIHYMRKSRRPNLLMLIIASALVFTFGISLPREYRVSGSLSESLTTVLTAPEQMLEELFGGADTAMVDSLASELSVVPSTVPFAYGATYVEALGRPIPRAVWPNKPRPPEAVLMDALYPHDYQRGTGFSFSILGEPWLNGGWLGVMLVMGTFGVVLRILYEWLQRSPLNITTIVFYALSVTYIFVYFRGGFGVDYQRQVMVLAPLVLLYKYARASTAPAAKQPTTSGSGQVPRQHETVRASSNAS